MSKIISLIPARGGSKGILNKNIKDLCGQPLISYTILDSLRIPQIEETYISTDSEEIANVALKYGAEVPFLRPSKLAKDDSLLIDVVKHFLKWYNERFSEYPKYLVLLLATTPIRDIILIDNAITKIQNYPESTGLRSVHEFPESPYKWFTKKEEYLYPLLTEDWAMLDMPRQKVPQVLVPNGYIDIIKPEIILNTNSVYGRSILSYITPFSPEIDNEEGFLLAEIMMKKKLEEIL